MLRILKVIRLSPTNSPLCSAHYTCQCLTSPARDHALHRGVSISAPPLSHDPCPKFCPITNGVSLCGAFSALGQPLSVTNWRTYSSKGRKKRTFGEEDHEYSDDEDETGDLEDWNDEDEDEGAALAGSKTWKDLSMNVPSLRIDAILSSGLGISRKKIEDAFFGARLRLNDNVISKKSKVVQEGDVVDIVLDRKNQDGEKSDHSLAVMRVEVTRIGEEKTAKDRVPVKLRRWKYLEIN